jgi:misacylated tRNA(Ala) deacylase
MGIPVTELLFRDDAYLASCEAVVTGVEAGGLLLDRTVFYPTGGGQPGDTGLLLLENGRTLAVLGAEKTADGAGVLHRLAHDAALPPKGTRLTARIDWDRRYRLMRTHSCLHLLCRAVDGAVTGGQVGELRGRLDFDIPEPSLDKAAIAERIMEWVAADRPIEARWIEDEEFDRRPDLVRTMSVAPPRGLGRVRLVEIQGIDLQACGGTHVRQTGEIGTVSVAKIEKKGKQNRRVVVELG